MTWNLADFAGVKFPTVASQVEIETPDLGKTSSRR
jgi:hypothetical protein